MYVLPTLYEGGSPKTLLEAMACALPVVTTSGFGVDEALEDGIHGFKCPPKDVKAFHDAIVTLLNDPLEARAMGERGRQRILEYYAIERAVERELKLLAELTAHA
jgi:glycosyltransferase involved in cell wall biosynthesis